MGHTHIFAGKVIKGMEWRFEEQEYEVIPLKCPHGIGEGVKWVCSLNVCGFFISHFAFLHGEVCGCMLRGAHMWACGRLVVM